MASDIEGQGNCDSYHIGYRFEVVVYVVTGIAIGASLVGAEISDNG